MAEENPSTDASQDADQATPDQSDQQLGDAGKRALQAERKARQEAEKARADLEKELNTFRDAQKTEHEKALDRATKETEQRVRSEVLETANKRLVKAHLTAAAAGKLADPSDAATFIDPKQFKVDDDGEVDSKALNNAIDDLIKSKPHLAANARSSNGDWGGGPRGKSSGGKDMNDLIRQRMRR